MTLGRPLLPKLTQMLTCSRPSLLAEVFGPPVAELLRELLARRTADPESRDFIRLLLEQLDDESPTAAAEPDVHEQKLSGRGLEVLRHLADGLSNQAIASALALSLPTVKSHVHSILVKLAAKNRTEAVAKARQHNLLAH
jgi:DNA-binding NarL/FixJ family response regulator